MAIIAVQITQNVVISRYFSVAGLVLLLYDIAITMEDEVSKCLTQAFESSSPSVGPPGLAGAFQIHEAALLHQPILDDGVLDNCQLPWVACAQEDMRYVDTVQDISGFRPPLSDTVGCRVASSAFEHHSHIYPYSCQFIIIMLPSGPR